MNDSVREFKSSSDYIIETAALTKQYGQTKVVNQVNIHVPPGKIYGLLGRNGAGKTTTMKMLLQLIAPSGGTVKLFGEDYRRRPQNIYSRIGSIIETPGFYENLTATENLGLLQRLRGGSGKAGGKTGGAAAVTEALRLVGLEQETHKVFADYSLGMKQRLGIAAAIMHQPELLILDEPINGLDPIGISEIRLFLADLCRQKGTTILISSHVLSEIQQLADIIGVMHEGRLIEEVDMAELHRRSRKYLEIEVSEPERAVHVLQEKFAVSDYSLLNRHEGDNKNTAAQRQVLRLYQGFEQRGQINSGLVHSGLTVTGLSLCEETLEDYFAELIGGGGIA